MKDMKFNYKIFENFLIAIEKASSTVRSKEECVIEDDVERLREA